MKSNWEGSEGVDDGPGRPSPSLDPAGGTDPRAVGHSDYPSLSGKAMQQGQPRPVACRIRGVGRPWLAGALQGVGAEEVGFGQGDRPKARHVTHPSPRPPWGAWSLPSEGVCSPS